MTINSGLPGLFFPLFDALDKQFAIRIFVDFCSSIFIEENNRFVYSNDFAKYWILLKMIPNYALGKSFISHFISSNIIKSNAL